MKIRFFVVFLLFFSACQQQQENSNQTEVVTPVEKVPPKTLSKQTVPEEFIKVNDAPVLTLTPSQLERIEENHYGDFYGKRATYYVIEDPENEMYEARVNNITLYFLDGELSKTKYDLNKNIANQLIAALGKFSISWKDTLDENLIKSKNIVIRSRDSIRINEQLKNYEMIWRKEDKHIRFEVRSTDSTEFYTYVEMKSDYKDALFEIKLEEHLANSAASIGEKGL